MLGRSIAFSWVIRVSRSGCMVDIARDPGGKKLARGDAWRPELRARVWRMEWRGVNGYHVDLRRSTPATPAVFTNVTLVPTTCTIGGASGRRGRGQRTDANFWLLCQYSARELGAGSRLIGGRRRQRRRAAGRRVGRAHVERRRVDRPGACGRCEPPDFGAPEESGDGETPVHAGRRRRAATTAMPCSSRTRRPRRRARTADARAVREADGGALRTHCDARRREGGLTVCGSMREALRRNGYSRGDPDVRRGGARRPGRP